MALDDTLGFCLASQQIRQKIAEGRLITTLDEARIQPSSFEPTIGSELFILDTETEGIFRPNTREKIYRTLLQLPGRQRKRVDISDGFELKRGFTYLVPLEEKIRLAAGEYVKSSPKSSFGRLFLNTRLMSDFNPCFDEVSYPYCVEKDILLWLLVQPLAFNLVAHPGMTFNQLRFFSGLSAKLTPKEVLEEFRRNPLLYTRATNGELTRVSPFITDGLRIHLDISGRNTESIAGLRARRNPEPIDLSKKGVYEAEQFFEPIIVKGDNRQAIIRRGEYYLFASKEILKIPPHLNVELKDHSHVGFVGPLHFAGFVDNGFAGDLVFEIRSDEFESIVIADGMPISVLDVFRTVVPDKLYGPDIGSHYQGQVGPKPAKYFLPFDFALAARNYEKLDRTVLVQDASILLGNRQKAQGFEPITPDRGAVLLRDIADGFFQSRYDCEFDEAVLQPIPYVVFFGPDNTVFAYVRAENIADYGDQRLFGKHSVGLGGHIIAADSPDYIPRCIQREVFAEEVDVTGNFSTPVLVGTLMAYDKPVDKVHFGLIFAAKTDGSVKQKESSIKVGRMVPIADILNDQFRDRKYETWSRVLIPQLQNIYDSFG
jgi:dCTP deaminase